MWHMGYDWTVTYKSADWLFKRLGMNAKDKSKHLKYDTYRNSVWFILLFFPQERTKDSIAWHICWNACLYSSFFVCTSVFLVFSYSILEIEGSPWKCTQNMNAERNDYCLFCGHGTMKMLNACSVLMNKFPFVHKEQIQTGDILNTIPGMQIHHLKDLTVRFWLAPHIGVE